MQQKTVPAHACTLTIGEFQLGDNGDNAKSAPIQLLARTGKPISHWYWGQVCHDLDGMRLHKSRLPIDYNHDSDQVIGYLNRFETTSGDLVASGALVPYGENDKATEVIFKSQNGVPYEASIYFSDPLTIEELSEGQSAVVNGNELIGPATIIREWGLRGVAVCPYGADANTETRLSSQREITVNVLDTDMKQTTFAEANEAVDAQHQSHLLGHVETPIGKYAVEMTKDDSCEGDEPSESAEQQDTEAKTVDVSDSEETEDVDSNVVESDQEQVEPQSQPDGKAFMAQFGEAQGAIYFANGLSFNDAMREHIAYQQHQIGELKAALSANRGLDTPIDFEPAENKEKTRFVDLIRKG